MFMSLFLVEFGFVKEHQFCSFMIGQGINFWVEYVLLGRVRDLKSSINPI